MAMTTIATGNALTKKLWEEKLFRDTVKESYWSRFMAENSNAAVNVKTALTKTKGDKITFGIRMRLGGDGVTGNQTLEGNERDLTTYDFSLTLERYRQAVKDDGALTRQRVAFSLPDESRQALLDWGSEKIDKLCFTAVELSPTKAFYGGTATSTATLTASDKLTPQLLSKAATWALTGGNRTQTPLRPIKVDGKNYLVCVVHNDVSYDLEFDSTFLQARREAEVRGKENPIFSGAYMIWNGIVVHKHENCSISTTYGASSNVAGALCTMFGAQALCWAWGQRPDLVEEWFDFQEKQAFAWRMTAKVGKPVFNSLDYGSVAIYVARTQISDAS